MSISKILVLGPIKDKSRIYGYGDNINIDQCNTAGFSEMPFQIYNFKGFLKLIVYPFIFFYSGLYYSFYIASKFKSKYKYLIVAPESPGLILLGKFISFFLKKKFPLFYIYYYWSPYLTNLDRKTNSFYSKVSILVSYQLEKLIFKFSDKILQSVSDEAYFLNENKFNNKYSDKISNISYPCFLKESNSFVQEEDLKYHKDKIYFWGSGAPLQGVDFIIDVMNLLSLNGYNCVFCAPNSLIRGYVLNEKIEIHYFEDKNEKDVLSFYEQMRRDAYLTIGIFGESVKANHVLPNKIVESLCLGIPCITQNSNFIKQIFQNIDINVSSKIIFVIKDSYLVYNQIKMRFKELQNKASVIQPLDTNYFSKEYFQKILFYL